MTEIYKNHVGESSQLLPQLGLARRARAGIFPTVQVRATRPKPPSKRRLVREPFKVEVIAIGRLNLLTPHLCKNAGLRDDCPIVQEPNWPTTRHSRLPCAVPRARSC